MISAACRRRRCSASPVPWDLRAGSSLLVLVALEDGTKQHDFVRPIVREENPSLRAISCVCQPWAACSQSREAAGRLDWPT